MSKSIGVNCPHCGSRLWVSGRSALSPMLSNMYAHCKKPGCFASYSVSLEITHQVQRSLSPKDGVAEPRHLWQDQLEHKVRSIELQHSMDQYQATYVEGMLSVLHSTGKLTLEDVQKYKQRLKQLTLI